MWYSQNNSQKHKSNVTCWDEKFLERGLCENSALIIYMMLENFRRRSNHLLSIRHLTIIVCVFFNPYVAGLCQNLCWLQRKWHKLERSYSFRADFGRSRSQWLSWRILLSYALSFTILAKSIPFYPFRRYIELEDWKSYYTLETNSQ